jgi:predicted ATPase
MASNALDYITVRGFKSIASLEKLPLKPVNVLIGSNGSGKSNFIGVFAFLNAVREGRLRKYVIQSGGAEKVLHFGSKTTKQIETHLIFGGEDNLQYHLVLSPTDDDGLYPSTEVASATAFHSTKQAFDVPLLPREQGREAGISGPPRDAVSGPVQARLGSWRLYHMHDTSLSSPMRKTAKVNDNEFLRPDGSNLAPFLYLLQERHRISYTLIRRTVRRVAPFFDYFRLAPLRLKPDDIMLEWKHQNSDLYFDASSFSDGTLRFIALATLFLQPKEFLPSVILVDEPELGLHPYAIEMLAALIRQASEHAQVIVSTQSSLLLDHFEPEDVLVANRVSGGTQIERLEPAQLRDWLKDYSLGQLWEKNEFAGRPIPE